MKKKAPNLEIPLFEEFASEPFNLTFAKYIVWKRCRREYKARYLDGYHSKFDPKSNETLIGTLVHRILQIYLSSDRSKLNHSNLLNIAQEQISRYSLHGQLLEHIQYEIERLLNNFYNSNWMPEKDFETEVPVKGTISHNLTISGRIDRLDIYPSKLVIIDYKSYETDLLSNLGISDKFQLIMYYLALPPMKQNMVEKISIYILDLCVENSFYITEDDIRIVKSELINTANDIQSEKNYNSTCGGTCLVCRGKISDRR